MTSYSLEVIKVTDQGLIIFYEGGMKHLSHDYSGNSCYICKCQCCLSKSEKWSCSVMFTL